ncbi:hypothetical protein L7F22_056036 [Adiantum nelumboides]|nr:hypothetical protein [Adiantum nelumboides]
MGEPSSSWQNFNFRDDEGSAQGMQALRLLLAKLQEAQANPRLKPSVNNLLMTEDLMLTSTQRLPSSVAPMHLEGGEGVPVMHGPMQANVVPHPLQGPLQTDGAKKKQYHGQERHVGKIREEGDFHDDDDEPPSRSRHKKKINERRTKRSRRNSSGGSSSSSQSGRSSHGRFPKKESSSLRCGVPADIAMIRSRWLFAVFLLFLRAALASEYDHKYADDEKVVLWVNKVGPYYNPQETYNYFSLPFCSASNGIPAHKWGGLGEVLEGNELIDSQFDIKFKKDVQRIIICKLNLDENKVQEFKDAIENTYWFEFFMDDLPLWGFVGEFHPGKKEEDSVHLLYTHKGLHIKYNNNQIIQVNLTQDNPQRLAPGKSLDLTYSVSWSETDIPFARRFDAYLDYPFFEHQIHWFSIFNSFMMVIFLTGLVSMILMRTLRNDYAKYAREEDDLETLERDVSEESGWKLVHGDVFRSPRSLVLLSALVGTGAQLAALILVVILLAIVGMLYVG